jgi:hypothetical protein
MELKAQLQKLWTRFSFSAHALVPQAAVVALMQRTGLPQSTLAAVWACAKIYADVPDVAYAEFCNLLRLCALAQTGAELTPACAQTHAGMDLPLVRLAALGSGAASLSPMAVAPAGSGAAARAVIADCARCSEAERAHYLRALSALGHRNLSATLAVGPDTMRGLLSRTGLPCSTLDKVWRVAQTNPGAAAFTWGELVLAMRLAALAQCNREPSLPAVLHEQTTSGGWSVPHVRFAGTAATPSLSSPAAAVTPTPAAAGEPEPEWHVAYGSALFTELDCARRGFVGGAPALSFLRRARLPEPVLRKLWALAAAHDAASRPGYLSRNGFLTCLRLVGIAQAGAGAGAGALQWLSGGAETSSAAALFAAVDSAASSAARFVGYEALLAAFAPPSRGREKFARGEHVAYIDSRGGAATELPAEILKVRGRRSLVSGVLHFLFYSFLQCTILHSGAPRSSERGVLRYSIRLRDAAEVRLFRRAVSFDARARVRPAPVLRLRWR